MPFIIVFLSCIGIRATIRERNLLSSVDGGSKAFKHFLDMEGHDIFDVHEVGFSKVHLTKHTSEGFNHTNSCKGHIFYVLCSA